jgi:hypothetical protein
MPAFVQQISPLAVLHMVDEVHGEGHSLAAVQMPLPAGVV